MFFCPNCNNIYDITKNIETPQQKGGQISDTPNTVSSQFTNTSDNISELINAALSDTLDSANIAFDMQTLSNHPSFKKLSAKNKELIINKLTKNNPQTTSNAFFICNNCGNNEPIKPQTLIFKKNYDQTNYDYDADNIEKIKNLANVDYIFLTRNYTCINDKCPSHDDHSLRAARFIRVKGSFAVRYVCTACNSTWI